MPNPCYYSLALSKPDHPVHRALEAVVDPALFPGALLQLRRYLLRDGVKLYGRLIFGLSNTDAVAAGRLCAVPLEDAPLLLVSDEALFQGVLALGFWSDYDPAPEGPYRPVDHIAFYRGLLAWRLRDA